MEERKETNVNQNGTSTDNLPVSMNNLTLEEKNNSSTIEEDTRSSIQDSTNTIPTTKSNKDEEHQSKERKKTGKEMLQSWLNKSLKIEMSDGRVLIGNFLCTDRDANVILGACTEFLNPEVCGFSDEPRILGLVMVPGRHIVSMHLEVPTPAATTSASATEASDNNQPSE